MNMAEYLDCPQGDALLEYLAELQNRWEHHTLEKARAMKPTSYAVGVADGVQLAIETLITLRKE